MSRIVIELTNRCNLRCGHCYDERHAGTGDLGIEIIEKILREARACGIDHLSFTGGEPTLHRQFPEIVRRVGEAAYTFSFVTNGSTFPQTYPLLVGCRTAVPDRHLQPGRGPRGDPRPAPRHRLVPARDAGGESLRRQGAPVLLEHGRDGTEPPRGE